MKLVEAIAAGDLLETARAYVACGLSVIPVRADGSKAPKLAGWRAYSDAGASEDDLREWFSGSSSVGIGIVPGPASGRLVVLDFECKDGAPAYAEWVAKLSPALRAPLSLCPVVRTPSGGRHVWVRLPEQCAGGRYARYANGKTKVEVRGLGHQVLAPGCPASCHASGDRYTFENLGWLEGGEAETDPLTWIEWLEVACALNEYAAPVRESVYEPRRGAPAGEGSPGTDFNRRGSWAETGLFDAGWKWAREPRSDAGLITRPGKDAGVSASVGMVTSKENGWPLFWCWSTSVPEFVAEKPYSRFAVYAQLRHGGDYRAAARQLAQMGYGDRQPEVTFSETASPAEAAAEARANGEPERPFKWLSELRHREANDKWLWHGYVSRGGITLLSALWKAGKSTLLSHMLRAFDGRTEQFLGQPITPARVLYVSEEHEELWAERRDELNIGDHVGMICRPFRGRPSPAEWAQFLGSLVKTVSEHKFDLVVMDTISKLWPVREENDAGQVEDALMPVWSITDSGAGLVLVHHNRKSDGKEFTGSRGSGGLPAFCETLVEFRRHSDESKDRKRILTGGGRYRETPDKNLIELLPSGYISHGDPDNMDLATKTKIGFGKTDERDRWQAAAHEVVTLSSRTYPEISALLAERLGHGVRREDLLAWLDAGTADGLFTKTGSGRKGDPHRWCRSEDVIPYPLKADGNSNGNGKVCSTEFDS